MHRLSRRAVLVRHSLTILAIAAAGACADDRSITAPSLQASGPSVVTERDGGPALTEATVITITPDRQGIVRTVSGYAIVSGSVTCTTSGLPFKLAANVEQYDRKTRVSVQGNGDVTLTCATTPQTWEMIVVPAPGTGMFWGGKADLRLRATVNDVTAGQATSIVRFVEVAG